MTDIGPNYTTGAPKYYEACDHTYWVVVGYTISSGQSDGDSVPHPDHATNRPQQQ